MGGFNSGLGYVILLIALLFTWTMVATFVSPELAALMGVAVIGLWVFFFLPLNLVREIIWRGRQKKIMDEALRHSPTPYQAGSALPPPSAYGGGASSGLLMVMDQPSSGGGALDVYRDLPQLPKLEPRAHAKSFWRAIALPIVGVLMFIGANNDTVIYALLEARGMAQKMPIAWEQLKLEPAYADYRSEMNEAARMVMRRERDCTRITGGRMAERVQFQPVIEQIERGDYVYEFTCDTGRLRTNDSNPLNVHKEQDLYWTWISPDELNRGLFVSIINAFSSPLALDVAYKACRTSINEVLTPLGATLGRNGAPQGHPGRIPYPDYVRVVSREEVVKNGALAGSVQASCWVGRDGIAQARVFK